MGKMSDLNVGNGKTASVVGEVIRRWVEEPNRTIFSNIKLSSDVDYVEFTPENIDEVLESERALVILDELHAIVHKNHRVTESCKKHGDNIGLCYRISQFLRQIRKRANDSYSTCQTFADAHYQYRTLMQRQIVCEKLHVVNGKLYKCDSDRCPEDHDHMIRQKLYQNYMYVKDLTLFDPKPFYNMYDSFEIVKGWVAYE